MTPWERLLADWLGDLDIGAELEVRDPDRAVAFLAPLARHYRLENPALVWVRPVVGGYEVEGAEPGLPGYAFHLDQARPRALHAERLEVAGEELVAPQPSGQVARIRAAGPATRAELERWDVFVYTVLSAEAEADLGQLWGDSWWGEWA